MLGALTVKSQPHFPKKTSEKNQMKVKVYWAEIHKEDTTNGCLSI